MTIKNMQQKIRRTILILSIAFGFLVLSAVSASAQYYPQNDQRQNRQDDRRDRQRERQDDVNRNGNNGYTTNGAQSEGYRDGLAAGRDDRRDREQYNPRKHSDYKRGTDGYDRRFGSRGQYKQAYRAAFLQGYAQSYNRNRNNNNNRRRDY